MTLGIARAVTAALTNPVTKDLSVKTRYLLSDSCTFTSIGLFFFFAFANRPGHRKNKQVELEKKFTYYGSRYYNYYGVMPLPLDLRRLFDHRSRRTSISTQTVLRGGMRALRSKYLTVTAEVFVCLFSFRPFWKGRLQAA